MTTIDNLLHYIVNELYKSLESEKMDMIIYNLIDKLEIELDKIYKSYEELK